MKACEEVKAWLHILNLHTLWRCTGQLHSPAAFLVWGGTQNWSGHFGENSLVSTGNGTTIPLSPFIVVTLTARLSRLHVLCSFGIPLMLYEISDLLRQNQDDGPMERQKHVAGNVRSSSVVYVWIKSLLKFQT